MSRLGGVDASFLYLESSEMPMHVAGLTLYELPSGFTGSFHEHFKRFFAGRLHLIPIFSKKLEQSPMNLDHPGWVEEQDVDLNYHIKGVVLPGPGSQAQLEEFVARQHSILMDRTRPLWQFIVVEGLADGRVALYSKVHHAAVDGSSGMIITRALYDITAEPRVVEPPPPKAKAAKPVERDLASSLTEMLAGVVRQQQAALRAMPEVLGAMANMIAPDKGKDTPLRELFPNLKFPKLNLIAPKTPFNTTVGNARTYAARTVSLKDAKLIAKASGVKINDVVMTVCGGALRAYLAGRKALPSTTLLAFVPISTREAGDTSINNQVSGMICPIGTDEPDPLKRLAAVKGASSEAKELAGTVKSAVPQDFTFLGAPMIINALVGLYGRFRAADWMVSLANVTISNNQGPPMSLYCAGARVSALYPVSIPAHGVALNLTVQSYCDQLDFGITADKAAVPDVEKLADAIHDAMEALKAAAYAKFAPPPAPVPKAPPAPASKAKPTDSPKPKVPDVPAALVKAAKAVKAAKLAPKKA